ncbi:2OG-Fe(II) oxygenase [Erythrobacter insulae]|uniref:2OG-Fe(II) oxygenase n=1 Tax=Erythrobacter insulae TaxID=2584124 RepID=A0A547P8J0_9SPHN|nr:2OG-Fe(II) oxygenase [Erythrobacter insulae]TRD10449.1 2OG-Fe(II) oxygenase [Erythrobacter insulae]
MTGSGDSSIEFLRAHPGVMRVPSPKVEMVLKPAFLSAQLCSDLIDLIESDRRPSTLADFNGDPGFRTSETCDMKPQEPAVKEVERVLHEFTGIDPAYGETLQGQRYEVGQEFKAHTDWFTPGGTDWEKFCSVSGQRTWTFMVYLNNVPSGGTTRFKSIGKKIDPEQGKLIGWNNQNPDGSGNEDTLHHAMKVRKGMKYVITKWYREKPWS